MAANLQQKVARLVDGERIDRCHLLGSLDPHPTGDVADPEYVRGLVEKCVSTYGTPDIFFANAGVAGLPVGLAAVVALLGAPVAMFASFSAAASPGPRAESAAPTPDPDDGVVLGARRTPRPPTSRARPRTLRSPTWPADKQ